MWIEDSRKNNLQSKEGHRGYRQQEALRSLQTDYKAKLHRFWHLLMQIAWPVSFSNFPVLPTAISSWMHCFAPQRCALFRHLNFQKWSAPLVLCPFWLGNVLRATTACTFSCLIWPAGSAPAALASLLFDPPEPQIIGKTQRIATFLSFRASTSSFFWSCLFWLVSPLLFNCPYCRKFHF